MQVFVFWYYYNPRWRYSEIHTWPGISVTRIRSCYTSQKCFILHMIMFCLSFILSAQVRRP